MCNACGNLCCGSDMFGECGCDFCDNSECWTPEDDDEFDDDPADLGLDFAPPAPPERRRHVHCEAAP